MKNLEILLFYIASLPQPAAFMLAAALKAAVISAVALGILTVMRRTSATARNMATRSAVAAVMLIPIVSLLMLEIDFSHSAPLVSKLALTVSASGLINNDATPVLGSGRFIGLAWHSWLMIGWVAGTVIILLRATLSIYLTTKLVKKSPSIEDGNTTSLMADLRNTLRIKRRVRLLVTENVATPFVFGVLGPAVIIPRSMAAVATEDLKMLLIHELAHIRRNDIFWVSIGTLAVAFFWFNPLIWIIRREMLLEADKACDDYVICGGVGEMLYADRLFSLARSIHRSQTLLYYGAGIAGKSQIEERILSLVNRKLRRVEVRKSFKALVLASVVLGTFSLAAVGLHGGDSSGVTRPGSGKVSVPGTPMTWKEWITADSLGDRLPGPDQFVLVDTPAAMIEPTAPPVYPDTAKKLGLEGMVWIKALVDPQGKVREAMVFQSSGIKILDNSALAAAWKNKFTPAKRNGRPVAVWVAYQVEYKLSQSSAKEQK